MKQAWRAGPHIPCMALLPLSSAAREDGCIPVSSLGDSNRFLQTYQQELLGLSFCKVIRLYFNFKSQFIYNVCPF